MVDGDRISIVISIEFDLESCGAACRGSVISQPRPYSVIRDPFRGSTIRDPAVFSTDDSPECHSHESHLVGKLEHAQTSILTTERGG